MFVFSKTLATFALLATAGSLAAQAQTDFPTTIANTHPLAFYRLDSSSGQSLVGTTTYKVTGSASIATSGAPVTTATSRYLKLDGKTAYITTTQKGGVAGAATLMAWINLVDLPSQTGHFYYIAGESENGNDLDLQIETDNIVKFFTASGGHVEYKVDPNSLIGQWHQVVATMDKATQKRVIYWDGKPVANDKGGGISGKVNVFTIGASSVFSGRFFHGSVDDAGIWSRALSASEVAAIYTAAGAPPSGSSASGAAPAASGPTPTTGPFATKATVDLEEVNGAKIQLKREEQIAYMFMSAFQVIELNCQLTLKKACSLNQMITASYPPEGKSIEHLKFDPNKTDPNYTYTVATNGTVWEAHANPKKPGLRGWCFMARDVGSVIMTYNKTGPSGYTDTPLGNTGVSGDGFAVQ
jgi:hypothetical protein